MELMRDGEARYEKEVPPGFKDANKENAADQGTFRHKGLTYQRKFGDLIFWRQTLAHVKENDIKNVVLITADQKEDWWKKTDDNKRLGPHPELVDEFFRETDAAGFWMYTPSQFLLNAKTQIGAQVTDQAVSELSKVEDEHKQRALSDFSGSLVSFNAKENGYSQGALEAFLRSYYGFTDLAFGDDFLDFIGRSGNGNYIVDVIFAFDAGEVVGGSNVAYRTRRIQKYMDENPSISGCVIFVMLSNNEFSRLERNETFQEVIYNLLGELRKDPRFVYIVATEVAGKIVPIISVPNKRIGLLGNMDDLVK
ncbi:hypothetical protein H2O14_02000 [Rhizobium sp. G21]|nr:hypothetical protein [Rhizobium sp. G21]